MALGLVESQIILGGCFWTLKESAVGRCFAVTRSVYMWWFSCVVSHQLEGSVSLKLVPEIGNINCFSGKKNIVDVEIIKCKLRSSP